MYRIGPEIPRVAMATFARRAQAGKIEACVKSEGGIMGGQVDAVVGAEQDVLL